MGTARSGVAFFVAKVVALGASFVAMLYFTRALVDPKPTLGKFATFESIVSFVALFANSGTNAAITKRISGATDGVERSKFVGAGIVVAGALLLGAVAVTTLALPLFPRVFEEGILVGAFVLLLLVILQVRKTVTAILRGVGKVGRSGAVSLVDAAGRAVAQVVLVSLGFGFVGLMAGAAIGSAVAALSAIAMVRVDVARPARRQVESIVSFAKNALVSGFTGKFYDNVDVFVILYFFGFDDTGVYNIGFRFSLPIKIFSGAISQTVLPEISEKVSEGDHQRVAQVFTDALIFSTLLAVPATVGVTVLAEPLIVTAATGEFAGAAFVAAIAVGIQIPDGVRSVCSTTLDALDRPDLPARSGFILIGVNLVLDLILVPTVGIIGAVVASFVGIVASTLYLGYHVLAELDLSVGVLPYWQFAAQVAAAVVMGAVVYWLRITLPLRTIPMLVVAIPVGVVVYFALVVTVSGEIRGRLWGIAGDLPVLDRLFG